MPQLTPSQLGHYREHGFVLVEDLLDPATDIDPVLAEYDEVLDNLANELFAAGQIASTYADLGFDERLCQIYNETSQVHAQHFDISLPQGGICTDSPIAVGPATFAMLRNEKLLDIIENLIGPEIYSNPVQHIRIKPPEQYLPGIPKDHHGRIAGFAVGATPWHQDNGVVLPEADETDMLTVWVPLTNAFREHGCIEVVSGSHRDGTIAPLLVQGRRPLYPRPRSSPRPRRHRRNEARRCALHAPADLPFVAAQRQRAGADQLRPPLQPHRSAHRPAALSRLCRSQPQRSPKRTARPRGLGSILVRRTRETDRRKLALLQSLAVRRPHLRLNAMSNWN